MRIDDSHGGDYYMAYTDHPIDKIEPAAETKTTGATSFAAVINYLLKEVITAKNPKAKAWQMAYCFNSIICQGAISDTCHKVNIPKDAFLTGCGKVIQDLKLKVSGKIILRGTSGPVLPIMDNLKVMRFINSTLQWIINAQSPKVAAYQIGYAIGASVCTRSMTEQGSMLGVGHAAISKGTRDFMELNKLKPSKFMKSEKFAKNRANHMKNKNHG